MRYSVSDYIHSIINSRIEKHSSILDMGGTGKMKMLHTDVIDANIRDGVDATNLSFEDNSFDVSVSIAVLEHVGNEEKQLQFINESIRVARKKVLHWFPIDEKVEKFLAEKGHRHFSVTPSVNIIGYLKDKNFKMIDTLTIREHLINLTMLYPKLSCTELYEYAHANKDKNYGILMELIK